MNLVVLIGRLGQDPELRYSQAGTPVAKFSLATSEYAPNAENQEVTVWHRIICFNRTAEAAANNLGKGHLVCVMGRLNNRSWEDESGVTRYITEVIAHRIEYLARPMGAGAEESQQPPQKDKQNRRGSGRRQEDSPPMFNEDLPPEPPDYGDDDIPF